MVNILLLSSRGRGPERIRIPNNSHDECHDDGNAVHSGTRELRAATRKYIIPGN